MIPLNALASVRYSSGPDSLDRFNNLPAVKMIGQGAPGVSSGQSIELIEKVAAEVLRPNSATTGAGRRSRRRNRAGLDDRARPRRAHGVPDPRRAVREMVAAALGAARAALRPTPPPPRLPAWCFSTTLLQTLRIAGLRGEPSSAHDRRVRRW